MRGVGFERAALWIPLRGFLAQRQGYTAVSRAQSLKGLFLVLPDTVVQNRVEAKIFIKDTFQPLLGVCAIKAMDAMRAEEVDTGGRIIKYATLWNSSRPYVGPALWTGV